MKSINPYNNQLIKEYTPYTPAEVEKILVDVDQEWQSWKKLAVKERATMMLKVSEVLLENKEKYAEMMALEMGKILKEARGEIEKCALLCRYYAESAEGILADKFVETDYSRSLVAH
jgi:succinate-semialdehyde dehydrogenase / glutarate-semialdehyde dehydrogenase